jgi:hypothetical protein
LKRKFSYLTAKASRIPLAAMVFTMLASPGFTQKKSSSFVSSLYLETKAHHGFVIPHHNDLWALTDGYFTNWEISVMTQTNGRKSYQYYRNYPQVRLTWLYSDFGGSEQLGTMHALLPGIHLPIIVKDNFKFLFGMGLGAAYMSKIFDRHHNPHNLAIGSHYNAAAKFELSFQFKLRPQLLFNTGISMLHISNGTIKAPNYGLNIPGLFAGFDWKLSKKKINYQKPEIPLQRRGKINLRLMGSIASRQIVKVWDRDFGVVAGNMSLLGYYNNTNKIRMGVDVIYDQSTRYVLEQKGKPVDYWLDITKIGLNLGHEWTFAKVAIYMNLGYYIHYNNPDDAMLYNQLGVNYHFFKFAFVGLNLQAHWAKAEFLSVGLGFEL